MTDSELERYIKLYRANVIGAALCYVKNTSDAEDIAQDVFFRLYTYTGTFESDEHTKAWLLRCTINLSKSLLRSHWYRFSLPLEAAGEKAHFDIAESDGLLRVMSRITKRNRIALYMYYYEGYSTSEIAEITGTNVDTVSARLSRGRKQLKSLLIKERRISDDELQRFF